MPFMKDQIELALSKANKKRRTRVIDSNDVFYAMGKAIKNGHARTGGGTVANCYGYPACQTVCEGIKTNRV